MTREEIIDELCRLRSDIVNAGGYINRTDAQKNRFAQALSEEIQRLQMEQTDEIKVGDEVYIIARNHPSVVTCIFSESGLGNPKAVHITETGKYAVTPLSQLQKTGRHFDCIVEVLKQLKGESDGYLC